MKLVTIKIGEILKNASAPMTIPQIADVIEPKVSRQTVFNHMKEAIANNLARDTGHKDGKAPLYESPDSITSRYYSIPWIDNKLVPLKTMFTNWCNKTPRDVTLQVFARHVMKLFRAAAIYSLEGVSEEESTFNEKIIALKEQRAALGKHIENLEIILRAEKAMYADDRLWHPRDLVSLLIIKDPDTTPREIIGLLDQNRVMES